MRLVEFCIGPAKVFSYRGKYKQYFLRVTADNKETWSQCNLEVDENRTVEIGVEEVGFLSVFATQTIYVDSLRLHS